MDDIETISIDLTDEDIHINQPEPQNEFVDCNNLMISRNERIPTLVSYSLLPRPNILPEHQANILPKKINHSSTISNNSEKSSELLIQSLQEENPQIETVFIESDEDNPDDNSKKMIEAEPTKTKSTLQEKEPQGAFKITNYAVQEVSCLKLPQNLVKNSSTIALQAETGDSTAKKFLVIPNEIAPFLAKSQGPISFNVPGIGPLLIPKPSDIFNSKAISTFPNLKKSPFLKNTSKEPRKEHIYEPLSDSKYCWRYLKGRKRDREGFSISDRLGFYKAEQHRSKICAAKYNEVIKKLQLSINVKNKALQAIKNTKLDMENIKLVEIDSIKKKRKQDFSIKSKKSPSIPKTKRNKPVASKGYSISPVKLSESDDNKYDNDLLVTKKVVFINETEKCRGRKRKKNRQHMFSNYLKNKLKKHSQDQKSLSKKEVKMGMNSTKYNIKVISDNKSIVGKSKRGGTNKTEITRKSAFSEKTGSKNLSRSLDDNNTSNKTVKIKVESKLSIIKGRRGRSRTKEQKIECKSVNIGGKRQSNKTKNTNNNELSKLPNMDMEEISLDFNNLYKIKDCFVEIPSNDLVIKALEKYGNYALNCIRNLENSCKIIDNLKQFQNEIQPIKPLLILNEVHCSKINFQELYCKYNIVFPMSEDLNFSNLDIKNMFFAEAAMDGYIKFVRPRCLCQYIAGFRV